MQIQQSAVVRVHMIGESERERERERKRERVAIIIILFRFVVHQSLNSSVIPMSATIFNFTEAYSLTAGLVQCVCVCVCMCV